MRECPALAKCRASGQVEAKTPESQRWVRAFCVSTDGLLLTATPGDEQLHLYLLNNLGVARAGLRPCPSWLGQETGHNK